MKALVITVLLAALFLSPAPAAAQGKDSDADGMPDRHELSHPCLMPFAADGGVDYDSDGLTSLAEYTYSPDLDPCAADTDGDGKNDAEEISLGSNPLLSMITPDLELRFGALPRMVSTGGSGHDIQVIWSGSEYYLADFYQIRRFDSFGNQLLGTYPLYYVPPIIWTGSELVLFNYGNVMTRLAPDLRVISSIPMQFSYQVAWTGSEFGLLNTTEAEIVLKRLSPEGQLLDSSTVFSDGGSWTIPEPWHLLWTGSEYLMNNNYLNDFDIGPGPCVDSCIDLYLHFMSRISPQGEVIDTVTVPSYLNGVSWTGSEFLLSFADSSGMLPEYYWMAMSSDLHNTSQFYKTLTPNYFPFEAHQYIALHNYWAMAISETGITGSLLGIPNCYYSTAVWNGIELAVFCQSSNNIYFSTLEVGDSDGDHLSLSEEITIGTSADNWDTDGDEMADGYEAESSCLDPLTADGNLDEDGDGTVNRLEFLAQTDPCDPEPDDGENPGDDASNDHGRKKFPDCSLSSSSAPGLGIELGFLLPLLLLGVRKLAFALLPPKLASARVDRD